MSSRQISWARRADRLLSARGPVSVRQYPIRTGAGTAVMSGVVSGAPRGEELRLPGEGHAGGTAVLLHDLGGARNGLLASPVTLPLAGHGQPGDRSDAGLDHAPYGHVVALLR